MGRAEGQSRRKLIIVKATIRSVGSALQESWRGDCPFVAGACGGIVILFRSMIGPLPLTGQRLKSTKVRRANTVGTWHLTR